MLLNGVTTWLVKRKTDLGLAKTRRGTTNYENTPLPTPLRGRDRAMIQLCCVILERGCTPSRWLIHYTKTLAV